MSNKTGKATVPLRRRGVWQGLAIILAGSLGLSSLTLGRAELLRPSKESAQPSSLAAAQMILRGPDQAMVGQRFTLEVLILNSGTTPLKDLEFIAQPDAQLELESKAREHRVAVEPIAPDDLQIVRLTLTPRKNGAGGVDITLRAKNGETEQIRHVMPIVPEDTTARSPERAPGASPLQLKITPLLKECFVDRPGIFLLHVLNTDTKPMDKKLDLVISYTSGGQMMIGAQMMGGQMPGHKGGTPMSFQGGMMGMQGMMGMMGNPTRQTQVSLPALAPGEGQTLPVRLTPRRIGPLSITIGTKGQLLATASVQVKFDARMPIEQLLPVRAATGVPASLPRKLADVPEVSLEDPLAKATPPAEGFEHVAHLIEKINHVSANKTDAFVEALANKRSDVHGLPMVMGDSCRLSAERGQHFLAELGKLRAAMGNPTALASQLPNPSDQPNAEATTQARIATLMQVVGPEGAQLGQQMVKHLATISHLEATRSLAKLAIFSEEDQVRQDAVAALAVRREKDVNEILLAGLSYPWPAVAQRAADALAKLKRTDLLPQLVEVLERPDPRAPQTQEKDGKKVTVVRELVRINHLRNCLLCHSPASPAAAVVPPVGGAAPVDAEAKGGLRGGRGIMVAATLTAPVPIPGQQVPTPTPHGGYGSFAIPEILVAIDVTYLRQDFSVKLPVANAQPWPEMQRFDFLVRTREITEKEAQAYRDLLQPAQVGELSPYQSAALASLRQLTGKDTEPTAAAWRRLLDQNKTQEK